MWKLYVGLKSFYQRSTFKNIMRRTKYNPKLYQQIIYLLKKLNIIIFDYDKTKQLIKKKTHHFANKGPYSQSHGLSSSHVQMWELDSKEGWAPKNWCFWTVVLEKTLESPLDYKEIKPVNPKGNQPWIFIGRTDAEAEAPILWPPDVLIRANPLEKTLMLGKIKGSRRRVTEDEMVGWYHWLNGPEFEEPPGLVMDRRAWHAAVHEVTKSQTQLSNWTELNSKLTK